MKSKLAEMASFAAAMGTLDVPMDRSWDDHTHYPINKEAANKKRRNRRRNRIAKASRKRNRV